MHIGIDKCYSLTYKSKCGEQEITYGVLWASTLTEAFKRARKLVSDKTNGRGVVVDISENREHRTNSM